MDKSYINHEDETYNQVVDSIQAAHLIERKIDRAETHSACEMDDRRKMEEQGVLLQKEREEMNERYKRNLEEQIKLQEERQATLEKAADEYRAYHEARMRLEEQLRLSDQDNHGQAKQVAPTFEQPEASDSELSLDELDRQFHQAHVEPLPDGLSPEEQLAEIDRRIHAEPGKSAVAKTNAELETPEMRIERRQRERQERTEARQRARDARSAERDSNKVENEVLLNEGVRQFLLDCSAVRKANIEALIENNPALKRFVAPESYVRDEIVPGKNVTVLGLAAEIAFKDHDGLDFTPSLATPIDGPARGVQAALREQSDPREVVKTASVIIDIFDAPFDLDGPSYKEPEFVQKLLATNSAEERHELVNSEIDGEALPLQVALSSLPDEKFPKVCIEALKGHGIDTSELEKEHGLVKVAEQKTPELTPREKELAYVATLSTKIEAPKVSLENEQAFRLGQQKDNSLSMERR